MSWQPTPHLEQAGRRAQSALHRQERSQAKPVQGPGLAPWGSRGSISAWLLAAWAMQSGLPSLQDMLWAMWKQEAKEQEWWHRDLLAKNEKLMKIMELQVMLQQSRMEYMAHKLLMQAKRDRSHFEEFFR